MIFVTELLMAITILLATDAFALQNTSSGPTQAATAEHNIVAAVDEAAAIARASDASNGTSQDADGATVAISGTHVTIYRGRPIVQNPALVRTLSLPVAVDVAGATDAGIFVDPDGTLLVQPGWQYGTLLPSPPSACNAIALTQTAANQVPHPISTNIDCASGRVEVSL